MVDVLVIVLLVGSVLGCTYMLVAANIVPQFAQDAPPPSGGPTPSVTVVKPLHGNEPGLLENLTSLCRQDYTGPVQIVFGVAEPNDTAIPVVSRVKAAFPQHTIELVVAPPAAAANPKVGNLINIGSRVANDIVVIADSDIHVPPDYLRRIVMALEKQRGGAVTCPYYGIAARGLWSQMLRLSIEGHFLPGVLVGAHYALSRPCLGSTIALRRRTLAEIGGFAALADTLADDYAIGTELAERRQPVTVLPFAVGHICVERSAAGLWRQELRWAMTIRAVDPFGYAGWSIGHAFPLAGLAFCLGGGWTALVFAIAALGCRFRLLKSIQRCYRLPPHAYWLIPLRDLWSFAVFVAGFFGRRVTWRGRNYRLKSGGRLMPEGRSP